jgi:predicted dehydrogenase
MNRRFIGVIRRAREALEQAGGAQVIHVQDTQDLSLARQYHEPESVMHHWMYANSIHTIDLLRYFGGEVADVTVLRPWTCTYSGTVLAAVEFAGGASGIYEGFWESPGPWACGCCPGGDHSTRRRPAFQTRPVRPGRRFPHGYPQESGIGCRPDGPGRRDADDASHS